MTFSKVGRTVARGAAIMSLIMAGTICSQTHFTFTTNTGNNMTVLIQASINPTVGGAAIATGDEIGVFDGSLCVGASVWTGSNIAITVWGQNTQTTTIDGATVGDTLRYRVWHVSTSQEIPATVSYTSGGPTYSVNGIAILSSLVANVYTVTYAGNGSTGGTVPTDANSYPQEATVTVLGNMGSLAKTGFTFSGWNTAANGSGTSYAAPATFSMGTANVTLYAQWSITAFTLSLAHVIGTAAPVADRDTTVNYGDTVRATAPAISGAVFVVWRITAGTAALLDSTAQPAKLVLTSGNATLTAVYDVASRVLNRRNSLPTSFDFSYNAGLSSMRMAVPRITGYSSVLVRVRLFDAKGRLLSILVDREMQAGYYDLRLNEGNSAMPVLGICRMDAKGFSRTVKVMCVK